MTPEKGTTHAQFLEKMQQNPEFRRQQRRIKPFYRIATEIIKLRNLLGLTQKELAHRAGTYQTRISKIESAELDIRFSTLIEVAEALECQVFIDLVPFAQIRYSISDEPYSSLFGIQAQGTGATAATFAISDIKYEAGPILEGSYGQCK